MRILCTGVKGALRHSLIGAVRHDLVTFRFSSFSANNCSENQIGTSVASSVRFVAPGEGVTSRCSKHDCIIAVQLLTLSLRLIFLACLKSKRSVLHLSSNTFTVSIHEPYSETCSVLSNHLGTPAAHLHTLAIKQCSISFLQKPEKCWIN